MAEVYRKFAHNGPRRPHTDKIAEELARHAVSDTWPEAEGIEVSWVLHQSAWLVIATGTIPEKGTT